MGVGMKMTWMLLLLVMGVACGETVAEKQVKDGEVPGVHALLLDKNGVVKEVIAGDADVVAKEPLAKTDMYWIASMTKPVTGTGVVCDEAAAGDF